MSPLSKKLLVIAKWLLPLLLLLIVTREYMYWLEDFSLQEEGGNENPVSLPISDQSNGALTNYRLVGVLTVGRLTPRKFNFIPDDRLMALSVNGRQVDLSVYDPRALGDYRRGEIIDLADHLKVGENKIVVNFVDSGGRMGLRIGVDPKSSSFVLLALLWVAYVVAAFIRLLRGLGYGSLFILILTSGLVIRLFYFSVTDYNTRAHDTFDHLDYVNYFVEHKALPPIEMSARRVFFHPPLYYASTAAFSSAIDSISGSQKNVVNRGVQVLSLLYSLIFMIFAVKIILLFFSQVGAVKSSEFEVSKARLRDVIRNPTVKYATFASALVVFWPSGVLHSTRVGNDPMVYMFSAVSLYYLTKFYFMPYLRYAVCFAIAVALGVLTKVSAGIFIPVALSVLVLMLTTKRLKFDIALAKLVAICGLIFACSSAFALYPGVALKMQGGKENVYIEDIDNLHSGLRVKNEARNYFWFDVKIFMTEPYTSPWKDHQGRQFFWNYLSKTSLFGEWSFEGKLVAVFASIVSLAFLFILTYTLIAALNMTWRDVRIVFPLLSYALAMYAAVTYMRITFPVNIDFRYIVPTLICSAVFLNLFLLRLASGRHQRFVLVGQVVQSVFVLASIAFIVGIFVQSLMS